MTSVPSSCIYTNPLKNHSYHMRCSSFHLKDKETEVCLVLHLVTHKHHQVNTHTETKTHIIILISTSSFTQKMILIFTEIQLCKTWHSLMHKLRVIMNPILFLLSYSQLIAQTPLVHSVVSCLNHSNSLLVALSAHSSAPLLCSSNPFSILLSDHF